MSLKGELNLLRDGNYKYLKGKVSSLTNENIKLITQVTLLKNKEEQNNDKSKIFKGNHINTLINKSINISQSHFANKQRLPLINQNINNNVEVEANQDYDDQDKKLKELSIMMQKILEE